MCVDDVGYALVSWSCCSSPWRVEATTARRVLWPSIRVHRLLSNPIHKGSSSPSLPTTSNGQLYTPLSALASDLECIVSYASDQTDSVVGGAKRLRTNSAVWLVRLSPIRCTRLCISTFEIAYTSAHFSHAVVEMLLWFAPGFISIDFIVILFYVLVIH